jgi:hypothetical protein
MPKKPKMFVKANFGTMKTLKKIRMVEEKKRVLAKANGGSGSIAASDMQKMSKTTGKKLVWKNYDTIQVKSKAFGLMV